jgi:hypothetical protein
MDCSLWKPVLARVFEAMPSLDCARAAALTLRTESLTGSRQDQDLYVRLWNETFDAIRQCSGKRAIVDSSKSSRLAHYRLPLFARHLSMPVHAIHLVRDPRGVMWSTFRGSNRRLEEGRQERLAGGMARGLLSWLYSNLAIETMRWRLRPPRMLRVRYEDIVQQPDETFAELSRFLGIAVDAVIERANRGDTFDPGHGIAGNRMRRVGPIRLRVDQEWHTQLPRRARATSLLALPLLKKYRYW